MPFADLYGVISFYALFKTEPAGRTVLRVCNGVPCYLHDAYELGLRLQELLGVGPGEPTPDGRLSWEWFACLGQCEHAPAMLAGEEAVRGIITQTLDEIVADGGQTGEQSFATPAHVDVQPPSRDQGIHPTLLLGRCGVVDPASIDDYEAHDGFRALRLAVERGPEWVIEQLTLSGLVGRGGAAFPAGRKWAAVRAAAGAPKYVILNADESEPGTFSNRKLLEEDPFSSVEAMIIAGLAAGSARGYAYIRGEYALAARRLAAAIEAARARGYLGADVLGTGRPFDIEIRRGGGAYICGEETSLFNSMEGLRGEPRSKPPFPVDVGVFRKPTLINNVETLVNVPPILLMGGEAFAGIGTAGFTGTKLFCLSGHIARPGVYEVPGGTTLRELIDLAGGVPHGRDVRAAGPHRQTAGAERAGPPWPDDRLGRGHRLRRHGRHVGGHAPAGGVLCRGVVRAVRALPRRHQTPGRDPAPLHDGPWTPRRRRALAGRGRRDERRLHLRPGADRRLGRAERAESIPAAGRR